MWDDAWLPGDSSYIVPTPNLESPADLMVADLINDEGVWDKATISADFTEANTELVREIPLSARCPCDVLFWWPTSNGIYTTKSGY